MAKNTFVYEGQEMKYCFCCKTKTWFQLFTIIREDESKLGQVWLCSWCNREHKSQNK